MTVNQELQQYPVPTQAVLMKRNGTVYENEFQPFEFDYKMNVNDYFRQNLLNSRNSSYSLHETRSPC